MITMSLTACLGAGGILKPLEHDRTMQLSFQPDSEVWASWRIFLSYVEGQASCR